jgi:hypothetical protein
VSSGETRSGGDLPEQRYDARQIRQVARAAARFVRTAEAGKVYCPYCRFREARWRRHFRDGDPDAVHLFVYCTQCHKTGLLDFSLAEIERGWIMRMLRRLFGRA